MAEDRTEDARVVAPAVAGADDHLLVDLIGNAYTGRPVDLVLHVPGQVDVAHAPHSDLAGVDVEPATVARSVDGLGVVDVGPEAVVNGQLVRGPPGVLDVVEMAPLPLARIRVRAHEAGEGADVPEEEGGEAEPATIRPDGPVLAEGQLTGSVGVAGDPQVVGASDVEAELRGVVAEDLREVRDHLPLLLVLGQRAVAAVDPQPRAHGEATVSLTVVVTDEEGRQTRREVVEVETGDPGGGRGCRAEVEG